MAEWLIEPLADDHEREAFSCGKAPLDLYLKTLAGQYARKDIGRTFVAVRPEMRVVIGYYTLAASAIEFTQLPAALTKKLPKHPVPTILLARLAVDQSARGKGLGRHLLSDAFQRVLRIAKELGVAAMHTHAMDEEATGFYAKFGFAPVPDQERHMILPMDTIRKTFGKPGKK